LREGGNKQKDTRSRIDGAAAAILLQSWLDGRTAEADP
jgi:RNase H-fold protein (predicted Holliday junction resolvase)